MIFTLKPIKDHLFVSAQSLTFIKASDYEILTCDMDFKVTGTRDGITATQMDIKVDGLS